MTIASVRRAALAVAAAVAVAVSGCSGLELYQESDLEMGRDWGRLFLEEVEKGWITFDEARARCPTVAKIEASAYPDDETRETFQRAVSVGCILFLEEAE